MVVTLYEIGRGAAALGATPPKGTQSTRGGRHRATLARGSENPASVAMEYSLKLESIGQENSPTVFRDASKTPIVH